MPSYDSPLYTYDQDAPPVTYDGTVLYPSRTGLQPSGTGQLLAHRLYRYALTGAQSVASSGNLVVVTTTHQRTLTGAQPSPTSAPLTLRFFTIIQLAGVQPAGSSTLLALRDYLWDLESSQPAGSGEVQYKQLYRRTLTGFQPTDQPSGISDTVSSYERPLTSVQPAATATLVGRYFHIVHVTLEGFQPLSYAISYDEPGVEYDEPGYLYEAESPTRLSWRVWYYRLLAGTQPPSSSTEIVWVWNPYVWAQYYLSITDRPEVVQYQFDLQASDHVIAYDVDDEQLHDPVVYKVSGVKVYSHPPPGVRDLP